MSSTTHLPPREDSSSDALRSYMKTQPLVKLELVGVFTMRSVLLLCYLVCMLTTTMNVAILGVFRNTLNSLFAQAVFISQSQFQQTWFVMSVEGIERTVACGVLLFLVLCFPQRVVLHARKAQTKPLWEQTLIVVLIILMAIMPSYSVFGILYYWMDLTKPDSWQSNGVSSYIEARKIDAYTESGLTFSILANSLVLTATWIYFGGVFFYQGFPMNADGVLVEKSKLFATKQRDSEVGLRLNGKEGKRKKSRTLRKNNQRRNSNINTNNLFEANKDMMRDDDDFEEEDDYDDEIVWEAASIASSAPKLPQHPSKRIATINGLAAFWSCSWVYDFMRWYRIKKLKFNLASGGFPVGFIVLILVYFGLILGFCLALEMHPSSVPIVAFVTLIRICLYSPIADLVSSSRVSFYNNLTDSDGTVYYNVTLNTTVISPLILQHPACSPLQPDPLVMLRATSMAVICILEFTILVRIWLIARRGWKNLQTLPYAKTRRQQMGYNFFFHVTATCWLFMFICGLVAVSVNPDTTYSVDAFTQLRSNISGKLILTNTYFLKPLFQVGVAPGTVGFGSNYLLMVLWIGLLAFVYLPWDSAGCMGWCRGHLDDEDDVSIDAHKKGEAATTVKDRALLHSARHNEGLKLLSKEHDVQRLLRMEDKRKEKERETMTRHFEATRSADPRMEFALLSSAGGSMRSVFVPPQSVTSSSLPLQEASRMPPHGNSDGLAVASAAEPAGLSTSLNPRTMMLHQFSRDQKRHHSYADSAPRATMAANRPDLERQIASNFLVLETEILLFHFIHLSYVIPNLRKIEEYTVDLQQPVALNTSATTAGAGDSAPLNAQPPLQANSSTLTAQLISAVLAPIPSLKSTKSLWSSALSIKQPVIIIEGDEEDEDEPGTDDGSFVTAVSSMGSIPKFKDVMEDTTRTPDMLVTVHNPEAAEALDRQQQKPLLTSKLSTESLLVNTQSPPSLLSEPPLRIGSSDDSSNTDDTTSPLVVKSRRVVPFTLEEKQQYVEDPRFLLVKHIHTIDTDTHVLVFSSKDRIAVAFRGTASLKNVQTDFDFTEVDCPYGVDQIEPFITDGFQHSQRARRVAHFPPKLHRGFVKAYESVHVELRDTIRALLEEVPERAIFVTGHSLGGGLAVLCVMALHHDLKLDSSRLTFTTWGCPKVGTFSFVSRVRRVCPYGKRFCMADDLITKLPLDKPFKSIHMSGWFHAGVEVLLSTNGNLFINPLPIERFMMERTISTTRTHSRMNYACALMIWAIRSHPDYHPDWWVGVINRLFKTKKVLKGLNRATRTLLFQDLSKSGVTYMIDRKEVRDMAADTAFPFADGDSATLPMYDEDLEIKQLEKLIHHLEHRVKQIKLKGQRRKPSVGNLYDPNNKARLNRAPMLSNDIVGSAQSTAPSLSEMNIV